MFNAVKRAVFLDRDGVLNKKRNDYVKSTDELDILPDVGRYLALLGRKGFALVIISNQSAVNRGLLTQKMLDAINEKLINELSKDGCKIDAVYTCPHKPEDHCTCRKPAPGLLLQAAAELGLDLTRSWIIGDSDTDIQAGTKVGCKSIKIKTDSNLKDAIDGILDEVSA